ncbi:uncharacterized protein CLUP02_05363 [Colletotrichum lupini]|uniref:Uncharacterized protein n=1 Tax=Colletotrichum lupini TaxID=145971 RepID=A0A9Q8WEJ5_9PEZI|nr:uncharacterized protein CLUP02_05363 [Colletotrichum lupini]UQC79882.1 hypothetical protein CLUP02_05363 [Colletotrichum lupini]
MIAPEKAPARVPKFLASALPIPHQWTSVPVDPHFPLAPPPPKCGAFGHFRSFWSLADMAWPSGWSAHLGSATVLLQYLSFVPATCTYLTPKPPVPSLNPIKHQCLVKTTLTTSLLAHSSAARCAETRATKTSRETTNLTRATTPSDDEARSPCFTLIHNPPTKVTATTGIGRDRDTDARPSFTSNPYFYTERPP